MDFINFVLKFLGRDVFVLIFVLLTNIIVARNISKYDMGIYVIILLVASYLEVFARNYQDISSVYAIKSGKYNQIILLRSVLSSVLKLIFFLLLVLYGGLYVCLEYEWLISNEIAYLLLILLIRYPFTVLKLVFDYYILATDRLSLYNISQGLVPAVTLLLVVFYQADLSLKYLVIISVVASIIGFAFSAYMVLNNIKLLSVAPRKLSKDFLSYARAQYVNSSFSFLNSSLPVTISSFILSSNAIANISITKSLSDAYFRFLPTAVGQVLYPNISSKNLTIFEKYKIFTRAFRITFILMSLAALLWVFLSGYIVTALYGAKYFDITPFLNGFVPFFFIYYLSGIVESFHNSTGQAWVVAQSTFIGLIVSIALSIPLTFSFGVYGLQFSLFIGISSQFFIRVLRIKNVYLDAEKRDLYPSISEFFSVLKLTGDKFINK
ncbi:polysaccharide biosynthesis C-terminal domain-containing protein [Marinobacterium sp. LSUCC0821]|uniref:polysaccharide biosynthesis C-terminal domain-containing protein n=1 Tax=Marinobacterium sp. LSUCC0821 TaxID=2668067 RepID=UPI001451F67E|nr:polysaccharide biosynthesis C-terminal domain-containing protein [Marinobacterium sp. LSUCC0821]QJD72176.1 hypothetical protein HH196_10935 [Marinobacterium sp. LSUCC0821]